MQEQVNKRQSTIGQNRGKKRIWLEGKILALAGFVPGLRYHVELDPNRPRVILLRLEDSGERKVSGKGKPIVDIMNQDHLAEFNTGDAVTVTARPGLVIIEG